MKHIIATSLAALSCMACTNIPYVPQPAPPTGIRYDPNVFSVGIKRMPDAELQRQKELAKAGDKRAAFNVYDHYRSFENDQATAMKWLKLAAGLGHASAQYILAQIYIHNNDNATAIHWAKRARDSKYPNAAELVERLENP